MFCKFSNKYYCLLLYRAYILQCVKLVKSGLLKNNNPFNTLIFFFFRNCIDEQLKAKGTDGTKKKKLQNLEDEIVAWAKKKNFSLDLKSKKMKDRDKKVVCKTFHGAGIVVPVDAVSDIGYRPVPETPGRFA